MELIKCKKCGVIKSIDEFPKDRYVCKCCVAKRDHYRYINNKTNTDWVSQNDSRKLKNKGKYKYIACWRGMMERCYFGNKSSKNKSYSGCCVCSKWHDISNFKDWYNKNIITCEGNKICIDKDLLGDGKLYSPKTCCFLPEAINNAIKKNIQSNNKSGYSGVRVTGKSCIIAQTSLFGIKKYIGSFDSKKEAREMFVKEKDNYIHQLAELYIDVLPSNVYNKLKHFTINNQ